MKAYQLHDTESEEILGTVVIIPYYEKPESSDELWEGWESFNKLEEHDLDKTDVNAFIVWFNENYVTQIDDLDLDFIQL